MLMASSYIGMEQQPHAKSCIKHILEVEPSDVQALYLRGQANELRAETAHRALRDYQRAYDICLKIKCQSKYRAVLEAKLNKFGGRLAT